MSCPVVFLITLCLWLGSSTIYADLKWDKETLALEAKANQTEVFGAYPFQNEGKKAVRILEVTTSCSSCTEASATKNTFAPGEKGEIQVVFHLANAEDVKDKQIFVKTDDGSPQKTLTLKIHVDEVIHFEPRKLVWKAGETRDAKSVGAEVLSDKGVSEIHVTSSSGAIKAEATPSKGKGRYQIKVSPTAGNTPASAWIRVEAKLKSGETEAATFFVNAQ